MPRTVAPKSRRDGSEGLLRLPVSRRAFCRSALLAVTLGDSLPTFARSDTMASAAVAMRHSPATDDAYDLGAAVSWLVDQQLPDGGFPGPSGASDVESTINVVMLGSRASARAGTAHDYLLKHGPAYAETGPGQAARLALAAIALFEEPIAFGGRGEGAISDPPCEEFSSGGTDLMAPIVAAIAAQAPEDVGFGVDVDADDLERAANAARAPGAIPGAFGRDLRDHAYILLALSAYFLLDIPDPETAIAPFEAAQTGNGGWAVDGSADPAAADARTTALVLQALADWERREAPTVQRGLAFLRSLQTPDGDFAFDQSEPRVADAISTAMAMQALLANAEYRSAPPWGNAPGALARFQTPSGGFRLRMDEDEPDLPATVQAMMALSNRFLPVRYFCS